MNLESIEDFAIDLDESIGRYRIDMFLSPEQLMVAQYPLENLNWDSIIYNDDKDLDKIPNNKRGIYAFAICHESDVLPPHGYILYIGIAGKDSNRSLRERYRDYLSEKKVLKRVRIARMIGLWHKVLRFYFAPVDNDVSTADLQALEKQLNTALMPVFSISDLDADIRKKRAAFK